VNEPKAAAIAACTDLTQAVAPADDLAKQMLGAHAEDLALEDAMRVLDRALQTGSAGLTPSTYLKQVRILSRRQFLARALGLKATEARRQQQQQQLGPPGASQILIGAAAAPGTGRPSYPPPPPTRSATSSVYSGASIMGTPPPPPPSIMWS